MLGLDMSVEYEQTLDEPSEPERCALHDEPRPCQECLSDKIDRDFEEGRDKR